MKQKQLVVIASLSASLVLGGGFITAESLIASRIESRVQSELPKAKGVKAELSLVDMPMNIVSDSVKSATITIDSYTLAGSREETSLAIKASNISKKKPTIIGSLDITATIPAATILENVEFEGAEIVGNTLQVSMGGGGLGQAQLVPKFVKNQIFFQLESVSIFGSKIPASSLPANIQDQVKSKSIRTIDVPKGLKVKSVSISSKGLSIKLAGSDIQLGKLGSTL
jgi:hypothetical protein